MLPRRFPRGARVPRPPQFRQLGYMEYYEAQEKLRPQLMNNRLEAWGKPGNEINPQLDCILYDGRIPREITDLILEYVLSPDAARIADSLPTHISHDFCIRNDHESGSDEPETHGADPDASQASNEEHLTNEPLHVPSRGLSIVRDRQGRGFDWFRPDRNHKPTCSGWTVLQTCRKIYLDAAKYLAKNREVDLYEGRGLVGDCSFADFARHARNAHDRPEFQGISSIRMYSQMYRLVSQISLFHIAPSGLAFCGCGVK